MKDTTMRYISTLMMIPREPHSMDANTIKEKLNDQGYDISLRSVQRDLARLSEKFPLVTKEIDGSNAAYWSWSEASDLFDIPGMSPLTAMTFRIVESYLNFLLPKPILGYLEHHFQRAKSLLANLKSTHYSNWHQKFKIIHWGPGYISPKTERKIVETIYQAVVEELQFTASYRTKTGELKENLTVNPLGIVFRQEFNYLVCTYSDSPVIRHLPLHRFQSASITSHKRIVPQGFSLDEFVSSDAFSYLVENKPIKLQALFAGESAIYREEAPLSDDQTIERLEDGRILLNATVKNSYQLHWWLGGFGDKVEVLKPESLRDEFVNRTRNLAKAYGII